MTLSITWLDMSLAGLALFCLRYLLTKRPVHPFPPGPRGLPLLGNVFDVPYEAPWLAFAKLSEKYGDICSINMLGQRIVIVSSSSVALDIMDKKSLLYSDRPKFTVAGELAGWNQSLILLQCGDHFREYRKKIYRTIGNNHNMKKYQVLIEEKTHFFLKMILKDPLSLVDHVRSHAGSIILRISHGYQVKDTDDQYIKMSDTAIRYFSVATSAGAFLVDVVPFLRFLPDWFPGTYFKQFAKEAYESLKEMTDKPHQVVKEQMKAGTALHSFTSDLLEGRTVSVEEENIIKWSALTLYSGGADTTVASIHSFFLAMTLFPDVEKKAQEEIDRVVGRDRLPNIDDRTSLPYIEALVLEILRWHCVAPLGMGHIATKDDVHDGYFIPKGAMIAPNIWKMLHDPRVYKNPTEFNPDRFIASESKPAETNPRNVCFGFGRRICPGIILAEMSIFISCAMALSVFNISKCIENGIAITPEVGQTTGTISHPKPFKCSIIVRSEKALSLIQKDI